MEREGGALAALISPTTVDSSGRVPMFAQPAPACRGAVRRFLSSSPALTNFMRLSLMKAAHASVGGVPCKCGGPWAKMDSFKCFHSKNAPGFSLLVAASFPEYSFTPSRVSAFLHPN